jgi:hypothetical protein
MEEHITRMVVMINAHRIVVGRLKGRPNRRWEDNIKMKLDLPQISFWTKMHTHNLLIEAEAFLCCLLGIQHHFTNYIGLSMPYTASNDLMIMNKELKWTLKEGIITAFEWID